MSRAIDGFIYRSIALRYWTIARSRNNRPTTLLISQALLRAAEQTMGQWVMGHGSNGSTNVNGSRSRGSRVSAVTHLTQLLGEV